MESRSIAACERDVCEAAVCRDFYRTIRQNEPPQVLS